MIDKKNFLSEQEINKIKAYPKVELHCHLDGSLPKDLIRILAKECNFDLPDDDKEFDKFITVTDDCKELIDCFKLFNFSIKLLQTAQSIKTSVFRLMQEASKENVKYIEIRFAPQLHTENGLTLQQIIQAAIDGLSQGKEQLQMEGGIIVCALGDFSIEKGIELFKAAQPFKEKGVVGVDLARVFTEHMNHAETFKVAKEFGFNITIHAGEFPPAQTILDCITNLNAVRIGHGVYAVLDQSIMQVLRDKNIPLEICITSNIHSGKFTQGFKKFEDHFVKKLIDYGIKVTINCDNRTLSNTTLTNEFCLLKQYFSVENQELKKIYLNSVEAAFTSKEIKQKLCEFAQLYDD